MHPNEIKMTFDSIIELSMEANKLGPAHSDALTEQVTRQYPMSQEMIDNIKKAVENIKKAAENIKNASSV